MRIIPAAGNGESCLGTVFRLFSNAHQYRCQIRLPLVDNSAFSEQNKVTKMCPKYLLTRYYKWSYQYQDTDKNRSCEFKQYAILSSLFCVYEYKYGRYSDCVSNIYGKFGRRTIWPCSLVVSASDSLTSGPGSIPGWAPIKHCLFFLLPFQLYNNELLPTSNINWYKWQKVHSITFYIELSSKYVGAGINFALLNEN